MTDFLHPLPSYSLAPEEPYHKIITNDFAITCRHTMAVVDPNPKHKASPFVRAITNPNEYIAGLLPAPKERDPNARRLSDNKFARAIGGGGAKFDYGLNPQVPKQELPPADSPLANVKLDWTLKEKLPNGYNVRSLQRDDLDRGYTKLKSVGHISKAAWKERCEYLRSRSDTYIVLVITDHTNVVVCTGTLLVERKFLSGMCMVGHAQDLLIGEGQQGKNLGLRMLDCLDSIARDMGCYKLVASTQETNEAFYQQKGEPRYICCLPISSSRLTHVS